MSGDTQDHGSHGAAIGVANEEPGPPPPPGPAGRRLRLPRPATVLAALAIVLFAAWGIGTPLIGQASTAATSTLVQSGPYPQAGFNDSVGGNDLLYDTYTSATPGAILFKQALSEGEFAGWDPNGDGGGALGSVPNDALLSPLTVPYYVLPTWMGPAYTEVLIIICGVGGAFLFLRRIGLSRVAGLLGGLAFVGSGFMVMWVDFPQTRTAAFVPALFWTVERFLQTRRVRDAVLIAIPIAAMLLGGFPAVTGYAAATASVYVLVRLLALYRGDRRKLLLGAAGYIGGIIGGVGLVAFQLLPFEAFMKTWVIIGRSQTGNQHLNPTTLLTLVAPWAFGRAATCTTTPSTSRRTRSRASTSSVPPRSSWCSSRRRCPGAPGRCCPAPSGPSSPPRPPPGCCSSTSAARRWPCCRTSPPCARSSGRTSSAAPAASSASCSPCSSRSGTRCWSGAVPPRPRPSPPSPRTATAWPGPPSSASARSVCSSRSSSPACTTPGRTGRRRSATPPR